MFCVGRLAATPKKHRIDTVMRNRAREDEIGMHGDMNDIGGTAELEEGWGDGRSWRKQDWNCGMESWTTEAGCATAPGSKEARVTRGGGVPKRLIKYACCLEVRSCSLRPFPIAPRHHRLLVFTSNLSSFMDLLYRGASDEGVNKVCRQASAVSMVKKRVCARIGACIARLRTSEWRSG